MKEKDIKVGKVYANDVGVLRLVMGIGQQYRPGSHFCDGVWCEQTYPGGRVEMRRIYLDSFARWARKEVKL